MLAAIALIAMMLQLGLALEPVVDRATKWRERRLVVRALAFNFALVPLLALLAQRALGATGPGATALLLLAASPGGRHAPALVKAAGGDATLSVHMTLWMNKLNPFVSPLLAAWLIGRHRVELRELNYIVQLFVLQIVPFFGARLIRKWRPAWADRLARPMRTLATIAAIALLVYLIAHHALHATLFFGVRGWLAILLFGAALLVLGGLAGGRTSSTRRTFAIASEARNLALALVIANMTVRDEQVLLTIFGAWVALLALGCAAVALVRPRRQPSIPSGVAVPVA